MNALFTNPWMLLWGGAVAVPLYLHFRSRGGREIQWGAMRILRAVETQHARSLRLWRLLLLCLRLLVVLLLALLFANPQTDSALVDLPARRARLQVIVLDCTASMQATVDGITQFERARERASELLRAAPAGTEAVVVGVPSSSLTRPVPQSQSAAVEALSRLQATALPASMSEALARIVGQIRKLRELRTDIEEVELVILTDGQWSTWENIDQTRLNELIDVVGSGAVLTIDRLEGLEAGSGNVAVSDARLVDHPALINRENTVQLRLHNYANVSQQRKVLLQLEDAVVWSQEVVLSAGQEQELEVALRPGAASQLYHVQLDEDLLPLDDRFPLPIEAVDALTVQQLGDVAEPNYLEYALRAARGGGGTVRFEGEEFGKTPDVLIVECGNDQRVPRTEIAEAVLAGRSGLLLMLGTAANPASIAAWMRSLELPVEVTADPLEVAGYVDTQSLTHPIVRRFGEVSESGLESLPVFRLWPIEISDGAAGRDPVLRLSDGAPLMLARQTGLGRTVILSTPLHSGLEEPQPWNAIAVSPVFVPLFDQTVSWLAGAGIATQASGSELQFTSDRVIKVEGPDETVVWQRAEGNGGRDVALRLRELGLYRLTADGTDREPVRQSVAVHLDPAESNLRTRPLPETVRTSQARSAAGAPKRSLLPLLIPLIGIFFVGETIVASFIRRRFS